jgi:hypothetical protein
MKCRIDITAATDVAAWVTREAFVANVNLDDLACRESEDVLDWYHPDWFRHDDNGELYFTPPAFEFRNGHLLGINGRHRAILLYRHLEVIPMLLVRSDIWPENKLAEIVKQEIGESETVELPDLPIDVTLKELGEPVAAVDTQKPRS